MTDDELITKLLDINQPMSNTPDRFSSIVLLLKGARKLFGCDINTGRYEMLELNEENYLQGTYHSFKLSGLINYLIFLEQVGSIFIPKTSTRNPKSNGITNALNHFSSLNDPSKIHAVASLRNSLAHRFGLATEKNPRSKPARKFTLSTEPNMNVVSLPTIDWSGDFFDKTPETSTTIFIIDLVELIEGVYTKIKEEHFKNNLNIDLNYGMDELKARYTITY